MLTRAECEAAIDGAKKWQKGLDQQCWLVPVNGIIPIGCSTDTYSVRALLIRQPELAVPYG